jgi:hypothetical protein
MISQTLNLAQPEVQLIVSRIELDCLLVALNCFSILIRALQLKSLLQIVSKILLVGHDLVFLLVDIRRYSEQLSS